MGLADPVHQSRSAALRLNARLPADAFPEVSEFPFPPGYAVGTVAQEVARTRCELSRARWELMVFDRTGRVPGRVLAR